MLLSVLRILISCSNDPVDPPPPPVIPSAINGFVTEMGLTPLDLNTPDKGSFYIFDYNVRYQVVFNATTNAAANAVLAFNTDTILNDLSREFTNLGTEAIAYNPVAPNQIILTFNDGRKVTGFFDSNTSFCGVFGAAVIAQWRDPADPSKPTQKAKDDIINLVHRYKDKDGPGPDISPQYLFAEIFRT